MSLYHTYRPNTLAEIKGNTQIVSALEKMLGSPAKMPQVFLFHGESGCGKTTFARIIKNTLNIADADYREINSSEMRGIDTIRELIRNAQFKPLKSTFSIYLVDEVHKMTNDAQNAFLKILEDTPKHIIFILATTDPQKLIKAIKGRCQTFQVNLLSDSEMKGLLRYVVKKEKETLEMEIIETIIKVAGGQPRNALQILEQVLSVPNEERLETAQKTEEEIVQSIELCRALIGNVGWAKIRTILEGLKTQDAEGIRRQVLGYATAVLLKGNNDKAALVLEMFLEPTYNSGFAQLVFAAYTVATNK